MTRSPLSSTGLESGRAWPSTRTCSINYQYVPEPYTQIPQQCIVVQDDSKLLLTSDSAKITRQVALEVSISFKGHNAKKDKCLRPREGRWIIRPTQTYTLYLFICVTAQQLGVIRILAIDLKTLHRHLLDSPGSSYHQNVRHGGSVPGGLRNDWTRSDEMCTYLTSRDIVDLHRLVRLLQVLHSKGCSRSLRIEMKFMSEIDDRKRDLDLSGSCNA